MRTFIIILFLLSLSDLLFAQYVDISILKFKYYYKNNEPEWIFYNSDSTLFKNDTLQVLNTYYFINDCSDYFIFKIKGRKVTDVYFSDGYYRIIYFGKERLSGKIKKTGKSYFLHFYKGKKLYLKFKIVELSRNKYFDKENYQREFLRMKLVRQD